MQLSMTFSHAWISHSAVTAACTWSLLLEFVFVVTSSQSRVLPFEVLGANARQLQANQRFLSPDGQCSTELWNLEARISQIIHPFDIQGHWVSTGCEIRANAQFLLRDYQFYDDGNFLLRQYFYEDEYCSKPSYAITAMGYIVHAGRSWLVAGANDVGFTLQKATVIPYSKHAAKKLTNELSRNCRVESESEAFKWPWLHEHKEYLIYYKESRDKDEIASRDLDSRKTARGNLEDEFTAELDCLTAINASVFELQLMRFEEVKVDQNYFEKRLFTGVAILDPVNRTWIAPTSFSVPIVNAYEVMDCKTCEKIQASNPISPPRLRHPHHHPSSNQISQRLWPASRHVTGEWLSSECESYTHGIYALRQMTFEPDSTRWSLRQRHYSDPACKHPSFTVMAEGQYAPGAPFDLLPDTQQFVYKLERVKLVPESRATVTNFRNADRCGGPTVRWRRGRKVDITEFGGCLPLGIKVPSLTHDIVRIVREPPGPGSTSERLLLFTGDHATVQYSGTEVPTAFQRPLQKCDDTTVDLTMGIEDESAKIPDEFELITPSSPPSKADGNNITSGASRHFVWQKTFVLNCLVTACAFLVMHWQR